MSEISNRYNVNNPTDLLNFAQYGGMKQPANTMDFMGNTTTTPSALESSFGGGFVSPATDTGFNLNNMFDCKGTGGMAIDAGKTVL
jgi:hypothetical protein